MNATTRAGRILDALRREYPDTPPLLNYTNPFELLVAVVLSAQTTDAQVNQITPELFRRFPGPGALAEASQQEVEGLIHSVGFFRTKAKNIRRAAAAIAHDHAGRIPDTIDELVAIPGVGRKSANVLLSHIHGLPGIIVDTHFSRVTRRLGLTDERDPVRIEKEIAQIVPADSRTAFSMTINYHGRYCCTSRYPACSRCVVRSLCSYPDKTASGDSDG